jgi:hypothetical protein
MTFSDRLWNALAPLLLAPPPSDTLFNPYLSTDPALDVPGAAELRVANLRAYLDLFDAPPPVLAVAEAPGYRGCRFSGIPLVSEKQLVDPDFGIEGVPTSRQGPIGEQSATIYARVLAHRRPLVFTWNAVPFHPHKPGQPLTNRRPTQAEIDHAAPTLDALAGVLKPQRIVAVGRVAEATLGRLGYAPVYVRHPAQGGARLFEVGMTRVLDELEG